MKLCPGLRAGIAAMLALLAVGAGLATFWVLRGNETRDAVLNLNLIFRYEYLPGSVLYLVFTRSHAGGQMSLEPGEITSRIDFSALGRAPVENAFLAKLSYHFAG